MFPLTPRFQVAFQVPLPLVDKKQSVLYLYSPYGHWLELGKLLSHQHLHIECTGFELMAKITHSYTMLIPE